jgi:hypothetical protein
MTASGTQEARSRSGRGSSARGSDPRTGRQGWGFDISLRRTVTAFNEGQEVGEVERVPAGLLI